MRHPDEPNFPIGGSVTLIEEVIKDLTVSFLERVSQMISLFKPKTTVYAHCDLPCGVYDPAQAKIDEIAAIFWETKKA